MRDQLTDAQVNTLVKTAVEKAEAGDSILLKFMLEQIYGKAPQPLTGDKDNPVWLAGVEITVRKK
ncbi:hypothetical protein [Bradyrhizobium sp.]|uniref:hypothetical protein n=1 Tax=Bradyrhizobium sp. TaxID=376 RepID=UPI002735D124|nr:hypothetical protein [Bradyrhizobium sp.]MDP3074735.1 hypothetical protein [Bradyrhizobium sp.]